MYLIQTSPMRLDPETFAGTMGREKLSCSEDIILELLVAILLLRGGGRPTQREEEPRRRSLSRGQRLRKAALALDHLLHVSWLCFRFLKLVWLVSFCHCRRKCLSVHGRVGRRASLVDVGERTAGRINWGQTWQEMRGKA